MAGGVRAHLGIAFARSSADWPDVLDRTCGGMGGREEGGGRVVVDDAAVAALRTCWCCCFWSRNLQDRQMEVVGLERNRRGPALMLISSYRLRTKFLEARSSDEYRAMAMEIYLVEMAVPMSSPSARKYDVPTLVLDDMTRLFCVVHPMETSQSRNIKYSFTSSLLSCCFVS